VHDCRGIEVVVRDREALLPALARSEVEAVCEQLDVEVVRGLLGLGELERRAGDTGRRRGRQADLELERPADEDRLV
jgi:hypothetical protein